MSAVITLTTDFGLNDAYVAAMKGIILGINPEAKLVDVCHTIKPQGVHEAAFVLDTVASYFPENTVHLVVVDPGVGTRRRGIILRTPVAFFVAPDNGVLSYVVQNQQSKATTGKSQVKLNSELLAVSITKPEFWRSPVSPTFHGRDIFAPVAARLSLGIPAARFGEKVDSIVMLPLRHPQQTKDGMLTGQIVHIDTFGNLITNVKEAYLNRFKKTMTVEINGQTIHGLSRTYEEGKGLVALTGSSGYLEIALRDGSARDLLKARTGDKVRIR